MILRYRLLLVCLFLVCAGWYVHIHEYRPIALQQPLESFPTSFGGWVQVDETRFKPAILDVLRPTDYLARSYRHHSGPLVGLYVGYHDGGPDSGPVHSPKHCLPGSGWSLVESDQLTIETSTGPIALTVAIYEKDSVRELYLYWYQALGETFAGEYVLKWHNIVGALLHGRRDTTFIRASIPVDTDEQKAFSLGADFVKKITPGLQEILPR